MCPECLTPSERREAAWRIVASLEAEIERRRRAGQTSDETEAALISHVLALRAELETTIVTAGDEAESGATGASTGRASDDDSSHTRPPEPDWPRTNACDGSEEAPRPTTFRVAMTAAFLTGCSLVVRIADYEKLQAALGDGLCRGGWLTTGIEEDDGTYETGGGFVGSLPLVVARREGHELVGQLSYRLDGPDHSRRAALSRVAPGYDIEPERVRIDVYDLGVAVLTAWFGVSAPGHHEPSKVTRTVMDLAWLKPGDRGASPIASALQEIACETVDDYGKAVRRAKGVRMERAWRSEIASTESGRLLWLHPVHLLQEANPSRKAAGRYAPVFHRTIKVDDSAYFVPGVNWSAVVARDPQSDGVAAAVRLTQLHWAYYAFYMELDRALMGVLNSARRRGRPRRTELASDADKAFGEYLRVMEGRARLDSALSALGGDNLAIWQTISRVQRFDTLVDGVERKVDVLRRLTQRRADEADAERQRSISKWLGGLAALTIVTVTITGIAYLFGSVTGPERSDTGRVVALVVAGLVALLLLLLAYRTGRDRRDNWPQA